MAHISILISSHNKPKYVKESLQSVLDQTHQDWEAWLMDSGVLLKQGFFDYLKDERFHILPTGETPQMAKEKNMAAWTYNHLLSSGKLRGELVMYLCDDDLLYKDAFQTYWDYYIQQDRKPQAMYASQDIALVDSAGQTRIIGKRIADRPAGRFCRGRKLNCQVDYLQFCHTPQALDKVREGYKTAEFYPEAKRYAGNSDGIFMERIGKYTTVHNIDKLLSMNRRTVQSVNLEYSESKFGRFLILLKNKFKGLQNILDRQYLF